MNQTNYSPEDSYSTSHQIYAAFDKLMQTYFRTVVRKEVRKQLLAALTDDITDAIVAKIDFTAWMMEDKNKKKQIIGIEPVDYRVRPKHEKNRH